MNAYDMGAYGQTLPVPAGDYDGNGYDDNAVYNYTNGQWIVYLNDGTGNTAALGSYYFTFGGPGAVPANIYSTIYKLGLYSPKPWPQ